MNSIRKRLVKRLTLSLTSVLVLMLVLTDVVVDSWVSSEFDKAMLNKVSLLAALISEDPQHLEFDFTGEFSPEFERKDDPEFFHIWHAEQTFARSETLNRFITNHLPRKNLEVGDQHIETITLPDGRQGKIIYIKVFPQIELEHRAQFLEKMQKQGTKQLPITIAYALSIQDLELLFWFIDISFILAAIFVILTVRAIVGKAVDKGLSPLDDLNRQINAIKPEVPDANIALAKPVAELLPIINSLNGFLTQNQSLLEKEKRLTSDIAHELKTPISELISLAEVSIRFPESKELNQDFKPEVLRIAERLKDIVSNILLVHRYSNQQLPNNDVFLMSEVITRLIAKAEGSRFKLVYSDNLEPIQSNLFAVESILTNLIRNAETYSPTGTMIDIVIGQNKHLTSIEITNQTQVALNNEDMALMFDPLWQKDAARTSTENFGLGLSIVKVLCKSICAEITVKIVKTSITFTLLLQ